MKKITYNIFSQLYFPSGVLTFLILLYITGQLWFICFDFLRV